MPKALVIVESPAKAKTINKYLGKQFVVKASLGHIKDLPKKDLAVDVEHGFQPRYEVIEGKKKLIAELKQTAKKVEDVYLAADPDREGEAICYHLQEELGGGKNAPRIYRVMFNEITKKAIEKAFEKPTQVNINLVDAQQARRVLDRLVGYKISPLLWDKVRRGLSAGRVQTVALRVIVEREREIRAFVPREYWTIDVDLSAKKPPVLSARLSRIGDQPAEIASQETSDTILAALEGVDYIVKSVGTREKKRNPVAPFITSTLQQESSRKLRFSVKRTMMLAQRLYEGIEMGKEGAVGLITYMRTDSTRISDDALKDARDYVTERYGKEFLPETANIYKSKKDAQDAHEAIRPTSMALSPEVVEKHLAEDEMKLYRLIWNRFVASQMMPALYDQTTIDVSAKGKNGVDYTFRATGSVLKFEGFLKVYQEGKDQTDEEDEELKHRLPLVTEGEMLRLKAIKPEQHFTEPPPRYTEASLVKTLEEYDIGRPSTYASIISTLQARDYVRLDGKAFIPTDVGMIVNKFLTDHFTRYVDYEFTAHLEDDLDAVSRGEKQWKPLLAEFWSSFKPTVDEKMELSRAEVSEARQIGTDPVSGKPVSARLGKYGPFVQIGTKEDAEKPRYASLRANQRIDTITLDQAIALFQLPGNLGTLPNGEEVQVNIGRFGPYVRHGSSFVSLKKDDDPYTIELPRAIELIEQKAAALEAATIKSFGDTGIKIIKGRFGPYISDGKRRARIPKGREPESLSVFECEAYLAEAEAAAPKKGGKAAKKAVKKVAAEAAPAAAKKAAAKKAVKKAPAKKAVKKAAKKSAGKAG